jgi:cardiolipin synthase A/B
MAIRWSSRRMTLTLVATVLLTILAVVLAMNFMTPEKKLERKIEHRYAIADPQFRREMSVMLGPSITARQPGRRPAERSGDLPGDAAGDRRGAGNDHVRDLRLLVRGNRPEVRRRVLRTCARRRRRPRHRRLGRKHEDGRVPARSDARRRRACRALPAAALVQPGRLNNRTHRKLLVVDGRVGFTGGVGIADEWLGDAEGPEHWRESHFRIEGPVVAQLQAAFNDNWIKTTGEVLNGGEFFPAQQPPATWMPTSSSPLPPAAAKACT